MNLNWGSRNDAVVRELKEGLKLRAGVIRRLSLLLVLAFCYSESFYLGFSSFPPSAKINTSKFQFNLETVDEEALCAIPINLNILFNQFYLTNAFI